MLNKDSTIKLATAVAVSALMTVIFLSLTQPIFSPDFWWHLATGKWIWNNGSLMQEDPFNFMTFPEEPEIRRDFILKQYWLSQVLLYLTYLAGGFKGIIILRALVLTIMFLGIYTLMRRDGTGRAVSALLLFMSWWVVVREFGYIGIRPQMFSSMFGVLLVLTLEELRRGRRLAIYALPLLMLLWANMHAGYTFGLLIISIYTAGIALRREGSKAVYVSLVAAILLSLLNPSGYSALLLLVSQFLEPGDVKNIIESVAEQKSVFSYSGIGGVMRRLPVFSALIFISAGSFITALPWIRRIRIELLLLYILLLSMAVSAARYNIFFATLAAFIAAVNTRWALSWIWKRLSELPHAAAIGALVSILVILGLTVPILADGYRSTALMHAKPYEDDYGGAAEYLRNNNITGRVFNDYGPGGYLIWSLYPGSQVFMDGRGLYLKGYETGRRTLVDPFSSAPGTYGTPLYRKLSQDYGIDIAVLSGCDKTSGVLIRLSLALLRDSKWHVVYADDTAIVFMKKTPGTSQFLERNALPDTAGYQNILSMAMAAGKTYYGNIMPGRKLSMAVGYAGIGENTKAAQWLGQFLRQVPNDPLALLLWKDLNDKLGIKK
jgi:hypothetical protein